MSAPPGETPVCLEVTFGDAAMSVGMLAALLGRLEDEDAEDTVAYGTLSAVLDRLRHAVAVAADRAGLTADDIRRDLEEVQPLLDIFHQEDR